MKTIPRRCGASMPQEQADEGWYWCDQKQGHTGNHTDHTDGVTEWRDQDSVCVVSYDDVRAVSDHVHDFVGDQDECVAKQACRLTYRESRRQQAWWEREQGDICTYCGHSQSCHTFEAPDEGGRDYCTECEGKDEFHAFDEEPKAVVPTRQQMMEAMRALTGPGMSQALLDAAVNGALAILTPPVFPPNQDGA